MSNLLDNKSQDERKAFGCLSTTFDHLRRVDNTLTDQSFYDKSGRIITFSKSETPRIPLQRTSINAKLMLELSHSLHVRDISHDFVETIFNLVIRIEIEDKMEPEQLTTIFIDSRPTNGLSFIHITIIYPHPDRILANQLHYSFIAHTANEVISELIQTGIFEIMKGGKS